MYEHVELVVSAEGQRLPGNSEQQQELTQDTSGALVCAVVLRCMLCVCARASKRPCLPSLPSALHPVAAARHGKEISSVTQHTAPKDGIRAHLDILQESLASSLPDINVSHSR